MSKEFVIDGRKYIAHDANDIFSTENKQERSEEARRRQMQQKFSRNTQNLGNLRNGQGDLNGAINSSNSNSPKPRR